MALGEFELIHRYFADLGPQHPAVAVGVGDDCALLSVPFGYELALSMDTLVAGVHFPEKNYSPYLLGQRALRVAASDLAAAGAAPLAFTLALTLPFADDAWLGDFSRGLADAAGFAGLRLIGGDTTRGPLAVTLQVHGLLSKGRMLRRNTAQPGDLVYVSGDLGAARAALDVLEHPARVPAPLAEQFLQRYWQPVPRLQLGVQLRSIASACLDISDGLLADVAHIADASQLGVELDSQAVPINAAVREYCAPSQALAYALTGGDDYELCFTVPANKVSQLKMVAEASACVLTCVGRVVEARGVRCLDADGNEMTFPHAGYQHFSS